VGVSRGFQEWQLKTFVVLPLVSRINQHAAAGRKLAQMTFKKLKSIEDSIEIIAREMARNAKRGK
jgi:hypothetical protein